MSRSDGEEEILEPESEAASCAGCCESICSEVLNWVGGPRSRVATGLVSRDHLMKSLGVLVSSLVKRSRQTTTDSVV